MTIFAANWMEMENNPQKGAGPDEVRGAPFRVGTWVPPDSSTGQRKTGSWIRQILGVFNCRN